MSALMQTKSLLWQQVMLKQKSSGLSAAHFCEENNIPYQTFCYWKRRFSEQTLKRTSFIELQEKSPNPGIILECNGIKVHLEKDFDQPTLSRIVSVLKETKC